MNKSNGLNLFFGLIIFCSLHCGDDDEMMSGNSDPTFTDLGVVTGLDLFDANGQPIGRWKSPNHKPNDQVFIFPIPSDGALSLGSMEPINRVWLIPAECLVDSVSFDIPGQSAGLFYGIPELEAAQIRELEIPDFNQNINLNFENVPAGFYRFFYQMESNSIFWQNLYIDPVAGTFPDPFPILDSQCD